MLARSYVCTALVALVGCVAASSQAPREQSHEQYRASGCSPEASAVLVSGTVSLILALQAEQYMWNPTVEFESIVDEFNVAKPSEAVAAARVRDLLMTETINAQRVKSSLNISKARLNVWRIWIYLRAPITSSELYEPETKTHFKPSDVYAAIGLTHEQFWLRVKQTTDIVETFLRVTDKTLSVPLPDLNSQQGQTRADILRWLEVQQFFNKYKPTGFFECVANCPNHEAWPLGHAIGQTKSEAQLAAERDLRYRIRRQSWIGACTWVSSSCW